MKTKDRINPTVIRPYRRDGQWMFDDPGAGLEAEALIEGMPEIIEHATRHIPDAERGFEAAFAGEPFPGATLVLRREREESGGTWYRDEATGREGWLCPALLMYFAEPPERLFVEVREAA